MTDRPNPFDDIERFFERMNRSLGDVGTMPGLHDVAVDVAETDTEIVVTADLPGFEKSDVSISLSGRDLTLEADHEERREETDDARYVRRERTRQRLSRTVRLPDEVDEESASATYRNGVLTVTLPRATVEEDDESHAIDID
jgi:HSP20 family protein